MSNRIVLISLSYRDVEISVSILSQVRVDKRSWFYFRRLFALHFLFFLLSGMATMHNHKKNILLVISLDVIVYWDLAIWYFLFKVIIIHIFESIFENCIHSFLKRWVR